MRLSRILESGPDAMAGVFIRRGETQTQRECRVKTGRGWGVARSQGTPAVPTSCRRQERSSPAPQMGRDPTPIVSNSQLVESRSRGPGTLRCRGKLVLSVRHVGGGEATCLRGGRLPLECLRRERGSSGGRGI